MLIKFCFGMRKREDEESDGSIKLLKGKKERNVSLEKLLDHWITHLDIEGEGQLLCLFQWY